MARKRRPRRRHATVVARRTLAPGASPGTLAVEPGAPPARIQCIAYGPDELVEHDAIDLDQLSSLSGQYPVLWVNVDGTQDAHSVERVGEVFGLHPLALEDVVHLHQRPKVEAYGDTTYIVLRMPQGTEQLELEQLSIFLGPGFVVTFRERSGPGLELVRDRLRHRRGRLRHRGADYLAYALVDAMVDHYFPMMERYGDRLEEIESEIVRAPDASNVADLHALRHDLQLLRHVLWPTRDTLATLTRDDAGVMSADTRIFLRDCHDHTIQLLDIVETCRDLASSLMDLYLSGVSLRMNEVMKVLTLIATIFIPLSFIASLYGMNFNTAASPWNMPELSWRYGYPTVLLLMALTATGLLFYFRRKGWLGGQPRRRRSQGDEFEL